MKKISIIIPAYNCSGYIEKSLGSVLNQTGAEMEIIVVNDGSTDDTLAKLEKYKDKIKLISIKNNGVANARNVGLAQASGDFIMFLDSDDCLEDGAVSKLISKQEEYGADIVRYRCRNVYPDGSTLVPEYQLDREMFLEKKDFSEKVYPMFVQGIRLNSVWASMFKRKVLDGLRFRTDMRVAEDAVFSMHAFTKAQSVLFIPDVLYRYYQTGTGLTGTGASLAQKYKDNFKVAFETISCLSEWGLDSPLMRMRALLRPVRLTVDKLKRMRQRGENK